MKLNIKTLTVFPIALLFTFLWMPAQGATQGATGEPEYLIFQMSTENRDLEGQVPEVKAEFGALPAGSPRYVGFSVALLTFTTPVEELRRRVTRALDHAEESGLPVSFQLDDMNFMPEYSDPFMVEWTAFPKPGETVGPRAEHYWLNWGSWMALPPPPNFESPAIRAEVQKRLREGVLPPLLERLAKWKQQKRSYLFAGIVVGWETGMPEYRSWRNAPAASLRDEQRHITMTPEERGEQLGYASLYARGWTQKKIEARARETGKSVEDVTRELLYQVVHDYTAFWAKTVNDAGIPKERIYTHGVAWESVPEQRLPMPWFRKSSRVPPVWVYVNPYCRPGYTMGTGQFEPEAFVRLLRDAGVTDGWGAVETYVHGVDSQAAFGGHLRQLFGNGAHLVDIWGWTATGTPYDPMLAPGALRAIHEWLEGKELPAASPAVQQPPPGMAPGTILASLQAKMERLHALLEQRQQEGTDMQAVRDLMQGFEPLMQQRKFAEAEALLDRALKLAGEPPATAAPVPQPPPGTNPGGPPASLQEKMQRLQALAQQRQQAGADLLPVVAIAEGVQPLLDQQRFSEAEALVDRALKLISEPAATEERRAASNNQKQPASTAAAAKPFPCPAPGSAIDLATGDWALRGDCSVTGITLRGDAQLWAEGLTLTVNGHVLLEQNAGLHIIGGSFTLANHTVFEHRIQAKGNALFDIRDAKMSTNAGFAGNLTSNYEGSDETRLHIENVQIDQTVSWLLVNLHDRARLETKDSPNFPNEIYPTDSSTVRIEGARSAHGVWLYFLPGSSAVLDNLPASHPYTFSFGRNTPGVTGIGYQVDVVEGNAGFGIFSFPRSKVTVRNNPTNVGLNYLFADVTSPETLTGLQGGRQTGTYRNQGRMLALENVELPPFGWQVYSANDGIPLESVAPVNVTDSLINEMGAMKQGRFKVEHVQFAFALIAAIGPSSLVYVRDSVINSQTILGDSDGVVKIEDSEIYGSLVQATGSSRIVLLNNALRTNERHPKCVPLLPSMDGSPPTRCNPFNPAREVQFVARGQGAVLVAGIDPITTAIKLGSTYTFVGDAIVRTPDDKPYTYNLRYRQMSAPTFNAIATDATGPKRAQPLGQLDTTGLAPGDYVVELKLMAPDLEPVTVRRPFTITVP